MSILQNLLSESPFKKILIPRMFVIQKSEYSKKVAEKKDLENSAEVKFVRAKDPAAIKIK